MTSLNDFFTFPWIKILFQEHLINLDDPDAKINYHKSFQRPFRCFVKEVYDGGNFLVLTDGFNEVRAKLLPTAKTLLREKYPSFCSGQGDSLTRFLIAVTDYSFIVNQRSGMRLSMSRSSLTMLVEINKLTIILAERLQLKNLVSKRFRSKYTGDMVSVERKTPTILSDADTAQFMKYYLHKRVKAHCYEDFKYEEIINFGKINSLRKNF